MNTPASGYRGRFAPSPTGPLHFGSLVAAMASYLDARQAQGAWLVRIEDIDEARAVPGAADAILRTLEQFGFAWDGEILVQSSRKDRYLEAISQLKQDHLAYDCGCTRKEVSAVAHHGIEGPVYPGTCRNGLPAGKTARAVRCRVDDRPIDFTDRIAGGIRQCLAGDVGDFIIHRADGFTAYQLAVVVDDADHGITDVVRGADLLLSTPRQQYLQHLLHFPTPRYAHVPLVKDALGRKLSKQDKAHPVSGSTPMPALLSAWQFLGQSMPSQDITTPNEFWGWAIPQWDIRRVPRPTE